MLGEIGTQLKVVTDKHGSPVHIGDTLSFDAKEWGGKHVFVLGWDEEECELDIGFPPSDITEWCEVVKRWDEK